MNYALVRAIQISYKNTVYQQKLMVFIVEKQL